ncbi:MAG: sugar phosphate isomerase/epimerase family protein [Thermodesulfobacteriota bacterium]
MKISISNIAWDLSEEASVAGLLQQKNIRGVEIAPTKIWPSPLEAGADEISAYRRWWAGREISIVAFQALLFGHPEMTLFETEDKREQTFRYLSGIIGLASALGAGVLVFGSPKNRLRGEREAEKVMGEAVGFFHRLAEVAFRHRTLFCIEPNAADYGCDFIRTAREGRDLVQRVNHPGCKLHLDAGILTMNNEPYEEVLEECLDTLTHFHISEPHLALIGEGETRHARIASHLKKIGYQGWVSIEMRNGLKASNVKAVEQALDFVLQHYGS